MSLVERAIGLGLGVIGLSFLAAAIGGMAGIAYRVLTWVISL